MKKLEGFVEGKVFQNVILVIILFNSVLIGLATSDRIMSGEAGQIITILDYICLGIFVIEMILKLICHKGKYFKSGWNIFDFAIIIISLMPNLQMFSAFRVARVLKVLRSLRALKMVSSFRKLRLIVESVFESLPGVLWTGLLLVIDFYIFAVLGTNLFGHDFNEWFGTIGDSLYTLFQVMTLESWSMGISRPVMEVFPWAWCYFVPFVIISAFIIMNVVVGIVVNTISEVSNKISEEDKNDAKESEALENVTEDKNEALKTEIATLKAQIAKIEAMIEE